MPIYIDPTIQLQVWCVDDSIKRNIHPDSFITDQHSGGLIGQTRGALYVPITMTLSMAPYPIRSIGLTVL